MNGKSEKMKDPSSSKAQPRGEKGFLTTVFDSLASVTLAITLLIILALTSILGTLIIQNARPDQYLQKYGPGLARVFHFLALDDMYRSWWFLSLLVLLLINIILCSTKRFPRTWKTMTQSPEVLDEGLFARSKFKGSVRRKVSPEEAVKSAREVLKNNYGKLRETRGPGSVTFFVDKGRFGRMGAYVVHLSILLLALGALYGGVMGFKGFVALAEGQTVDRVPLRNRPAAIKLGFSIRCDDFQVVYYPGTMQPKDYYSDLTILRDGQEVLKKRIEVNHPLIVDGIYFYQSSYGIDRGSNVTLQVLDPAGKISGPAVTVHPGQRFRVMGDPSFYVLQEIIPNAGGGQTGARLAQILGGSNREFFLLSDTPERDRMRGGPVYFRIQDMDIVEYTGLQVAWDPGVPIIWVACLVMILGLYLAFFVVHQRIWVKVGMDPDETAVLMAGTTNRNPASFEKDFENTLSQLKESLKR